MPTPDSPESPKPPATPPPDSGNPPAATARYREVTILSIVLAIVIGVVMNAAITYAGLKIGFTITGSAIAAVLGFGILRGVFRKGSILETNIVQTVASAVNSSNSGVIFTVPVLFLLGYQISVGEVDFWLLTLACIAGGFLGTAFIIPLRKQMLDIERLRFPSAVGVASILRSPGAGPAKALVLVAGIVLGALIYLPAGLPGIQRNVGAAETTSLLESGRIDQEAFDQVAVIESWIKDRSVPIPVLVHGRTVASKKLDRKPDFTGFLQSLTDEELAWVDGFDGEEPFRSIDDVEKAAAAEFPAANAELALAAVQLTDAGPAGGDGTLAWESLRSKKYGWPQVSLPGYGQLDRVVSGIYDFNENDREDGTVINDGVVANDTVNVGRLLYNTIGLPKEFQIIFAIAPFALGAGYITGRAGLFVLAGGLLAFFVITPIAFNAGWLPPTVEAEDAPNVAFGLLNRPLGIGLLLGGAFMGVVMSLPAIREAFRAIAAGSAKVASGGSDELSLKLLITIVVAGTAFLFVATDVMSARAINTHCLVTDAPLAGINSSATQGMDDDAARIAKDAVVRKEFGGYVVAFQDQAAFDAWNNDTDENRDLKLDSINAGRKGLLAGVNRHLRALIIAVIGGVWIWFAGIIIAQCTGMTDWSPISGMALLTIILIMLLAGGGAVMTSVLIGATLCVAITLAADMMGDMKTGYLIGGIPRRQQIAEIATVWIGPAVCMLTIMIIATVNIKAHGVAFGEGTPTPAPQAQALEAVITGVQGGDMPYTIYGIGAMLGVVLGLGAFAGLGVLIGISMYLPFFYIATYGIGCVVNIMVTRIKGKAWAESWGVPFAAGLIVGESLLSLGINLFVLLSG